MLRKCKFSVYISKNYTYIGLETADIQFESCQKIGKWWAAISARRFIPSMYIPTEYGAEQSGID